MAAGGTARNRGRTSAPAWQGVYPGERHLCTEAVELHLQALRAVGVVMLADPADDEARQDLTYVLSADGKARVQRNLE